MLFTNNENEIRRCSCAESNSDDPDCCINHTGHRSAGELPCRRKLQKKIVESKLGSAEEKARQIIDDALKTAETKKREALLEAKEESLKMKNESEKETRERRTELQRYEKRVLSKEEAIDKKLSPWNVVKPASRQKKRI